jgi:hypothetical protein
MPRPRTTDKVGEAYLGDPTVKHGSTTRMAVVRLSSEHLGIIEPEVTIRVAFYKAVENTHGCLFQQAVGSNIGHSTIAHRRRLAKKNLAKRFGTHRAN